MQLNNQIATFKKHFHNTTNFCLYEKTLANNSIILYCSEKKAYEVPLSQWKTLCSNWSGISVKENIFKTLFESPDHLPIKPTYFFEIHLPSFQSVEENNSNRSKKMRFYFKFLFLLITFVVFSFLTYKNINKIKW